MCLSIFNWIHRSSQLCSSIHLKDFLNMDVNCTWSNHLLQHNARSFLPTAPWNNRLAIEIGWWMIIHILRTTRLCHFCSYNTIENEANFMLECPMYNPIRDKFPSLFENVVPRSMKSFFRLDQQVNISLYLIEAIALRHSRELIGLKPSWCTFNPISLFGFPDFKSVSFHWVLNNYLYVKK